MNKAPFRALETARKTAGALVLAALVVALAFNVIARAMGFSIVGANLLAAWLLPALAFLAVPKLGPTPTVREGFSTLVVGFALGTLVLGMAQAAFRIGGTEPVLGIPVGLRFGAAAGLCGLALGAVIGEGRRALAWAAGGVALALLPLPPPPLWAGVTLFGLALAARTPVALALIAAVALSPGALSEAALAQSIMRGLSGYVLLAVPLFILAAGLLVVGGLGAEIVKVAQALTRRRASGLGEANVVASFLFSGVSASSIADVATGARLLAPAMIKNGYTPARAAAITACSAVLPNVMPPSIALLLAAAATDLSVGTLWLAGAVAAPLLMLALIAAVRLTPPQTALNADDVDGTGPHLRDAWWAALPVLALVLGLLAALRFGLVTAVEAGVVAVALSALYAARNTGVNTLWAALTDAAERSGRVGLLIAAAAPVAYLVATSGFNFATLLPADGALAALLAGVIVCLLVGTVLDTAAAILLILPVVTPVLVAAGADPVHTVLVLTISLLFGGLTPPVGILILVVKEITQADGVYRAVIPYLISLLVALGLIAVVPILWLR